MVSYVLDASSATLDLVDTLANSIGGVDTIRGEGGEDVLIGGAYGDRIDGGSERDLIFGDNVRLDRTMGDGAANARYRMLSGAEGGQIYSTIPATAGSVLVTAASQNIPGGAPVWEDFSIELLDHDNATETAAGSNFGNDYIAGGAGQRPDLRPARQRHHPGRRLDRPCRSARSDSATARCPCMARWRPPPTATTTSRATAATT